MNAYLPLCLLEIIENLRLGIFQGFLRCFLLRVLFAGARFAFGVDIACLQKGYLGQRRADKLVYKNGEKGNTNNHGCNFRAGKFYRFFYHARHTEGNACLGQEGDTEILNDVVVAVCKTGAEICARVFTRRTEDEVYNTD